jgi:prolyl-tRNA synthetase
MKTSKLFLNTKKNVSKDISKGQAILEKGGFFYQTDVTGVYACLPLGHRLIKNIEKITNEELESAGFSHVELATLQSQQLWERSDRWSKYNATQTMYTATDGRGNTFALAPTAEESAIQLMESGAISYNNLPINIHQISTKYRNELRPRGLTRGRAFSMSDAYSSHATLQGMMEMFDDTLDAYHRIFTRIGLPVVDVQADSGSIGGSGSTEIVHVSPIGDDTILHCNSKSCTYAANVEKANAVISQTTPEINEKQIYEEVYTPGVKSVTELCSHFDLKPNQMIKTVIFEVIGCPAMPYVAACIRGDLDVNPVKLSNLIDAIEINPACENDIKDLTGADVGFAGPINLNMPVFFDVSCRDMTDFICGCNQTDYHSINVNFDRALKAPEAYYNLLMATEGMGCPSCLDGVLESNTAIELGHCFQLGKVYTKQMNFTVIDENGESLNPYMGCYGIGITRVAAVCAEHFAHSHNKVVFPLSIAPFQVAIIPANTKDQSQLEIASLVEKHIKALRLTYLFEDRQMSFGKRLADQDLFGSPIRIIAGKLASQGIVELHNLLIDDTQNIHINDLPTAINKITSSEFLAEPTPFN